MNEEQRTPTEAVEAAIRHFGSAARMADALGVSGQTVSFWRRGEREGKAVRVPAELCPKVERLTRGAVRCEELQPDVEWGVLREHGATGSEGDSGTAPKVDRRDPTRVSPYEGSDIDRRTGKVTE